MKTPASEGEIYYLHGKTERNPCPHHEGVIFHGISRHAIVAVSRGRPCIGIGDKWHHRIENNGLYM